MNENPGAAVPSGTEADPAVLSDAAARLNAEFGPAVNAATVDRILDGSLAHLTAIGLPTDRLPALAERFARERLTAMARTAGRGALSGRQSCSSAPRTPDARRWRSGSSPAWPGSRPPRGRAAPPRARRSTRS
nr:hypothetical protein [Nocardia tengchongensis]